MVKVVYTSLEDKFIILLVNLDVRLGIFIYVYELHTEDIVGCRWNNHGWMVILHWIKVCSVYRPFVVTTKLSSIVPMKKKKKKKKKTDRTRCCNSWHHTHRRSGRDTQAKQEKKKGSVYVIEDTARRREREGERERKGKKCEWNSMLVSMEAIRLRRIFNSSLLLCLFPFPLVHDCITQYIRKRKRERESEEERKREKCIFNIWNF